MDKLKKYTLGDIVSRLDLLEKKFKSLHDQVATDIERFETILEKIDGE